MLEELRQERTLIEEAILALERILLRGNGDVPKRRGRPPKSAVIDADDPPSRPARKRQLSPEGRARIAEAAKKRWAAARQQKTQG